MNTPSFTIGCSVILNQYQPETLKTGGVHDSFIAQLIGNSHANDSMTTGRYGKRYQPRVLLEALEHLDYGIEIKPWKG